ncbi:PQQ-binding-like beta-propeller repeat protein [bacterium]|nr:PQQ-binding-like beta-propeller repeat protein [bacterium]
MIRILLFCVSLLQVFFGCSGCESEDNKKEFLLLWQTEPTSAIGDPLGSRSWATPLIVNNIVYISYIKDQQYFISAFGTQSGNTVWTRPLSRELSSSNVLYDNGRIYYNLHDSVLCLDAQDGNVVWSTFVESPNGIRNLIMSSDYIFYGNAYYDKLNPDLFKISKTTGQVQWKKAFSAANRSAITSTGYDKEIGYIYTGLFIEPDTVFGNQSQVFCLNQDSQIVWSRKFNWQGAAVSVGSFVFTNEKVMFGTGTELRALNKQTGDTIWSYDCKDGMFSGQITVGTKVYAGNSNGSIYCFDITTGKLIWKQFLFGSLSYQLSNDNKALYACNGDLWALDLNSGKVILRITPPGHDTDNNNIFLSPVGVGDGKIFIVGTRAIYCYASLGETE